MAVAFSKTVVCATGVVDVVVLGDCSALFGMMAVCCALLAGGGDAAARGSSATAAA